MTEDKGIGIKSWISGSKPKNITPERPEEKIILDKHRIAVLPFDNISPDPNDEYFADGMTEELIYTLSLISNLRVIARTSVMKYKGAHKSIGEIGQELRTGTLLEGSVRKVENRLRATVQLIDAATEEHLWAQTFDRDFKDVFSIQSDIARSVAETLRVKLLPMESSQLQRSATQSTEAYTEYLKGRFLWNKRSKEAVEKAIEHFQSAIKQDSNYALAYAGLADCYSVAADWGYMPEKAAYAKAKRAALKALELDNNLAEAHVSLAGILANTWSWTDAESEFKRAIELNPNYATARQWYSILLATLGRPKEALVEAKKASELDPLSPIITTHVGWRLLELGEYDSSIEQFEKTLEMQPDFHQALTGLAMAYAKNSNYEKALWECQKISSLLGSESPLKTYLITYLAYIYALCGRKDDARRILQENFKNLDGEHPFIVSVAMVYSAMGDRDKAMGLLERGYKSHNYGLGSILLFDFDNLRSNPKFIELQKKLGLRE